MTLAGDALQRAAALHQEAAAVLQLIRLEELLRPFGPPVYGGSYFLDLMAYPDIDLYLPPLSISEVFTLAGRIAEVPQVIQVVFERSNDPSLPGGLYLKPRIQVGGWGRPWKIDMWSLDAGLVEQIMAEMRHWKATMTAVQRQRILRYKSSVLTKEGRTPKYSGYFIYKAVLDEGLEDFQQVTDYLLQHGIKFG